MVARGAFAIKVMVLPAAIAALLCGCQTVHEAASRRVGQAALDLSDGTPVGSARVLQSGDEISLSLTLTGVEEGAHGLHLHAIGSCEAPDFTSAGAHLNPADRQHGFENPKGAHLGDLPNAVVGGSGAGTVSALLPGAPQEVLSEIFDADGTAILVYAEADDNRSDPAGNSGGRIACGVLVRG